MRRVITLLLATLPAFASTITSGQITGFGTTSVSASALVSYFGSSIGDPSSISFSADANAETLGPIRSGFIEITGSGGGESGSGSGSVGGYSFGCSFTCSPMGYLNGTPLPFTLGVPFQVDASAFANLLGTGSGLINFQFSVFESVTIPGFAAFPGEKVIVFDPPAVPEPATFIPVGLGLILLTTVLATRRSRLQN